MGVKDLWSILSASCEKKSLWELEGLTIAIDLSSWIVDSQNIGDNSVINMYLRNLFFRTSYMLLLGVKPIFILEGKAPELKHATIARRLEISKGIPSKPGAKGKSGNRGRLNCLQKRCEELLLSMGVHCYRSEGEAEALCSRLNELQVVDAVISQDSDCFLYGAQVVLRNFTMSPSYTCDMYTMQNIKDKLNLGRQKLLALSLLCGCDYEAGVQGVGKQSALKFLATIPDEHVIDRLRSWRNEFTSGCQTKLSQCSQDRKLELNIAKKAILDPNFPSEEVILEFMTDKSIDLPKFIWNKPSLVNFMAIAERHLAWEDEYVHIKFMPLLTRWHLLNGGSVSGLDLLAIVKKRSVRSVPSYELNWQHDSVGSLTTTEPMNLVIQVYPQLHEAFVDSKKPKKGTKGKKTKPKNIDVENVENLFENLNISGEVTKQPIKKRAKQKPMKGLQSLDRYFLKQTNNLKVDHLQSGPVILHSTPVKNPELAQSYHYLSDENDEKENSLVHKNVKTCEVSSELTQHTFSMNSLPDLSDNSAVFDLSDIVNSIVKRTDNPALNIWTKQVKEGNQ